jgi:NACHT domain
MLISLVSLSPRCIATLVFTYSQARWMGIFFPRIRSTSAHPPVSVKLYPPNSLDSHPRCRFPASLFELLKNHINQHAAYDSLEREREEASICQEGTRMDVLEEIELWARDRNGRRVCWLNGPAGSGKSTIAHTIAHQNRENLAFSFFFSRRHRERSDTTKFFLTFAYQLAMAFPSIKQPMRDALEKEPAILHQRLEHQLTNLIINPFLSITESVPQFIVVIDGLDECGSEGQIGKLVQLLIDALPKLPFRFLFTSRLEAHIEAVFTSSSYRNKVNCIALCDFNALSDVYKYLRSSLSKVQEARKLPSSWPSEHDLWQVAEKSESIFIYASTLVKFVDDEYDDPQRRFSMALKAHKGLDFLFDQLLTDAKKYPHFEQALGAVIFVRGKPHINILAQLLHLDSANDVRTALRGCLSILLVPGRDNDYVRPYHASLLDFLSNPDRRKDRYFDPAKCNGAIIDRCMQLITRGLVSDAASLRYASQNWWHHIRAVLSYAKDSADIVSYCGPNGMRCLTNPFVWFKDWMVAFGGPNKMKRACDDLSSTIVYITVGQAILNVTHLTLIFM